MVCQRPYRRVSSTMLRPVSFLRPVRLFCCVERVMFLAIFASIGPMATTRIFHSATLLSTNNVLICGGLNGTLTSLLSCELYDMLPGVFSKTGIICW